MSRAPLRLVVSNPGPRSAVRPGQRHRSILFAPDVSRAELPLRWCALVQHLFGAGPGARGETALAFGVTLQTACNWHDGLVAPSGPAVAHALRVWPDLALRFLTDADGAGVVGPDRRVA